MRKPVTACMLTVSTMLAAVAVSGPAIAADIAVRPGPNAAEELAEALIGAQKGDTIWLGFGR